MVFNARHSSAADQLSSGRVLKVCALAGLATRPSRLTKKCALSCTIGPPKTPPNSYLLFDGFSTLGSSANCWALKKLRAGERDHGRSTIAGHFVYS